MTYPELCSKVEHLQKRISSLRDAASKGRKRSKEAEAEVLLDELSTALEELQAAQEELHQKSEEIVSTHHAAEQERLRYQELFEFAPGGYLVTDSSGTILEANRQAASLLNITPESLCGKPLSVFVTKDEHAIFFSRFSELAHAGGTREWETRLQPCKKQAFHASLTAAAARDPEGEVTGFRWLVVDITDRKQTEKELTQHRTILEELVRKRTAELEEGQRSIRLLFEESDVGMAYIDREHRYVAMNRSLAEINGLSQETHGRVTLEEVLGADSPVIRMVDELFRAGNPVHRKRLPVSVTNRKDRQPGYYDISYLPVKAADGTITAMAAFVVDVTEHVLAEKTLRENEERYQLLFESVTDVIYTIDREFRVTSITPSVETISGYKPEEIVGRRIDELELVPPEYIEQAFNRTTMSLAGQPTPPIEYQFIAKDGTRKFCEVNAASLVKDDKIIGSIDVVRDITDRKRMEEALRQSEERYGEIIANVNEVFFELDESGAFTYYSHQMFDSLGYSEGDLIGKQAIEYIHPDDVPQVVRAIEEAFSGKVVRGLEYRFRSKSGEYRWFLTSGRAGDSRNGKGRVVQGMSMDITGRKQAEQELLETKEHLQSLMDNANDIVYTQDLEGNLTFVNRRGLDILGYNVAEWIGVDPHVLMSQEEAEKGLQHRTLVHAGIPQSYETRLRHRDGSLRLFSVNEVPIWKAGKVSGAFGIARDITEKRKLREDLLETRNYLQGLLDNASDIIFTADLDDRITFINHKGIETASELGIDWRALDARSIVAPEDRDYEASRQERLREGIPQSGEIRVVTKKSGVRTYSVNSAPIIKDGNPVGVVGIARDVTEQKELERALEKSRTEAHLLSKRLIEVQEEERRRISRDLHDELGQFVTSVKMDVDSLLKFVNIKDCELDRIAHNVHRTLAATLATIRRISTALRPNILDDIGLVAAIEAYLEQFQATTRIKCEWKCRVEREGYGSTIDTCLYRILQEALNNVIRHARAAFVRVELFQKNGKLVMVIEDNGLGFDVSGTGANSSLGIIGMKERVGLIGGSVIIHSTPGTGTIVEIEAPVAEEER